MKNMLKKLLAKGLCALVLANILIASASADSVVSEVKLSDVYSTVTNEIHYCINVASDVKLGIYRLDSDDKPETVAILSDQSKVAGCYSETWDGKMAGAAVETGSYYYGLYASNTDSNDYQADWISVSNDDSKIKIVDVEVDNKTFNPYDNEQAEITFTINRDAEITLTIFDDDDDEVVVIEDEELFSEGEHSIEWDGEDEFDDLVKQGTYEFKLVAKADGEKDTETGSLKVDKDVDRTNEDTQDPRIKYNYATKAEFDPGRHEKTYIIFELTAQADLTVDIYDEDGDLVEELKDEDDANAGAYRILWDGDAAIDQDGTYTYVAKAKNSKGSDTVSGEIKVSEDDKGNNKPNIYKDAAEADNLPFAPKQDSLSISFTLEKQAEITLEIRDDSETIKTILDGKELGEGAYTFNWDGRDDYGSYLSDGIYKYKLTAANFKGKDVEWGYFSVEGSSYANNLENCAGFTDVSKNSETCDAIKWAKNNDIFVGYDGGEFRPNQAITRTEALKVILEALDVNVLQAEGVIRNFPDLQTGAWYSKYIKTGLSLGIVNGYPSGLFKPNQPVNRIEALVMMLNTGKVKDDLVIPSNNYGQPYYDTPNSSSTAWYMSYVWMAKEHNLSSSTSYFYPESYMTRADMADMLYRYHLSGLSS